MSGYPPQDFPALIGTGGFMLSPFDYIIYKSGSVFYARNGNTGNVDYSDTDAEVVLADTINADGLIIAVRDATFTTSNKLIINHDKITLLFFNAVWQLNANAGNAGIHIFEATGRTQIYIDFINSYIDCNIANQTPTLATNEIDGLYFTSCTKVEIPNIRGTGFGSTKCEGFMAVFITCTEVSIGDAEGYYCGGDVLAFQGCNNVQVNNAYGKYISQTDSYGAIITVFTFDPAQTTENIQIGKIIAETSVLAFRIGCDYGTTRKVSVGQIIANGVQDAVSIDNASPFDAAAVGYDFSIGSIIASGITRYGLRIASQTLGHVHDIDIGDLQVVGTGALCYGSNFYQASKVHIGHLQGRSFHFPIMLIDGSTNIQVDVVSGKDVSSDCMIRIQNSSKLQFGDVYGYNIGSAIDDYQAVFAVVNSNNAHTNEDIEVNQVMGNTVSLLVKINGDYGTTRNITINAVSGENVYDAVAVERSLGTGTVFDVKFGTVGAYDVQRMGMRVASLNLGEVYNITFESVKAVMKSGITDANAIGCNLYKAKRVRASVRVEGFYRDGILIDTSTECQVFAQVLDCNVSAGAFSGVHVNATTYSIVHLEAVVDDRGGSKTHNYALKEEGASDYNVFIPYYVTGYTVALYVIVGAHSAYALTADLAVAKVGGGTRTIHYICGFYVGYTDS
jgi:hypothetical protein